MAGFVDVVLGIHGREVRSTLGTVDHMGIGVGWYDHIGHTIIGPADNTGGSKQNMG